MELVHTLLTAAMADDGIEDDQVKEEYGKTADDTLASLRAKLVQARHNEGKEGHKEPESNAHTSADGEAGDGADIQHIVDDGQLSSALAESTQKVCHLCFQGIKICSLLTRTSQISSLKAELAALKDQTLQHTEAAECVSKDVEGVSERMSREQALKINELVAIHDQELAALRAKLSDAESRQREQFESSLKDVEEAKRVAEAEGSEKVAEALEAQAQEHAQNMKLLEGKLADAKRRGVDTASRFERMESEVSSLMHLLDEERQKSDRLAQDLRMQQEIAVKELDEALNIKDKEISNLESEMQDLQATNSRELEELESAASAKESHLEAEIDMLRTKARDLESVTDSVSASHDDEVQSKDREIMHQSEVIEDLQNKIQQLHEVKEREIEEVKSGLISEHEHIISRLRREQDNALLTLRAENKDKGEEVALLHQQEKESLGEEHKLALNEAERRLADITALKSDLEKSVEATTVAKATAAKDYQQKLEKTEKTLKDTQLAQKKANEALDKVRADIGDLESERDQAEAEKLSVQETLKAASCEVTSLKKTLETLENASSDTDKRYSTTIQKMKDEADAASKLLEDKVKDHSSALEAHVQELLNMRDNHNKEIKGLEKKHSEALRTLQKTYDNLQARYEKAEAEHPNVINALKSEHADVLGKHAKELETLKTTYDNLLAKHEKAEKDHLSAINSLKSEHANALEKHKKELGTLKTTYAEEMTKIQSQIQGSDDLQKQHDKDIGSLRKEFEESTDAQKTHEAALADLQKQLEKQSKVLADTEQQLQETLTSRSEKDSEKASEAAKQMEELGRLLADAQAKAALDKEAIDKLTKAVEEASDNSLVVAEAERLREKMSELTEQHAAEISKLQEAASLGNDQREEERKHTAEIRDRLVTELEELKAEMTATNEKMEEQQQALVIYEQKVQETDEKLAAARSLGESLRSDLQNALAELNTAKVEAEKTNTSIREAAQADTSATNQMLEALRAATDAKHAQIAALEEQLRQAEETADKHATRVREVESALKVTTAELVEMRTERPRGSEYTGSPSPVLRSSLWPVPDTAGTGESKATMVGEELGSSIVGRVGFLSTFAS